MATCGLRRAECACLRVDDVIAVGQGWTLRVVGKGGHERVVPCPPHLARRIRARRGGWVFPGGQRGHVSPGWLGKQVSRALGDGGTAHTLRHRYASVAYGHTHDLRAVQTLLGHASVATTQVYTAVDDAAVRDVAVSAWRIVS
ncbi:tyrosine-type recombinase/integrase [Corynebacterium senegalense]|uniref:tyrosine-type recombinase/integrase n=1 Tax=Corynebacterium senegalense TaxID=2080750 RepID=UPI001FEAF342|nr:tyrosine-type recombinase/integrase [Corynebacterium senegalense]